MNRRPGRRPLRFAGNVPFTPKAAAGLVLWLRSDLGVTGSPVSAWADQSGTGDSNKNVVQAGAGKPTFTASNAAYNNKPTINFASASSQFLLSAGSWATSLPQPYSVFVVGNNGRAGVQSYFDGNVGGRCETYCDPTTDQLFAGAFLSTGDISTSPRVMGYVAAGASSQIYISSNTAAVTGNAGTDTITGTTIGAAVGGIADYLNGSIAEIIVYNRTLPSSTRAAVNAYLGTRYGIVIT